MNKELTAEQEEHLTQIRAQLIEDVLAGQDIATDYPLDADGRIDFSAQLVEHPLEREDVTFLVDEYFAHRSAGMGHQDAARITYACAYRQTDLTFSPHQRVAELRAQK